MIKKVLLVCILILTSIPAFFSPARAAINFNKTYRVLVAVYDDNEDYRAARKAFTEGLSQQADRLGLKIKFIDLFSGSYTRAQFISELKKTEKNADMIFTTGTVNALAVKEAGVTKPVIFSAVASPKRAGLVETYHSPGTNFTGCYCFVSADSQMRIIRRVLPKARVIGLFYTHNDPTALYQSEQWKRRISYLGGYEVKEFFIPEDVSSAEDVEKAAEQMAGKVDVIVTFAEGNISHYGRGVVRFAIKHKIPLYASLGVLVNKGALFSLEFHFAEAAQIVNVSQAIAIIKGRKPQNIPVGTLPEYGLAINLDTAKKIGVKFPERIINRASRIIQ